MAAGHGPAGHRCGTSSIGAQQHTAAFVRTRTFAAIRAFAKNIFAGHCNATRVLTGAAIQVFRALNVRSVDPHALEPIICAEY